MKVPILFSEIESRRFNLKIYRGILDCIEIEALKEAIYEGMADVVVFRIKAERANQLYELNRLGFPFVQADTLVYYNMNLESYQPKEFRNKDLNFKRCGKEDIAALDQLVESIFSGYTNHYDSNPSLDNKQSLEGYKEWVLGFVEAESDGKYVYLVEKNRSVAGFATVQVKDGVGEGILYGVLPSFSGGGIYSDIIRFTQAKCKEMGLKEMRVSTQVQNYAVQKVWVKEGFFMQEAYATIHINSMLSHDAGNK